MKNNGTVVLPMVQNSVLERARGRGGEDGWYTKGTLDGENIVPVYINQEVIVVGK